MNEDRTYEMYLTERERDLINYMRSQPIPTITEISYGTLVDGNKLMPNKGLQYFNDIPSEEDIMSLMQYEEEDEAMRILTWGTKKLTVSNIKNMIMTTRPYWNSKLVYWFTSEKTARKISHIFGPQSHAFHDGKLYGMEMITYDVLENYIYICPLNSIAKLEDKTVVIRAKAIGILEIEDNG